LLVLQIVDIALPFRIGHALAMPLRILCQLIIELTRSRSIILRYRRCSSRLSRPEFQADGRIRAEAAGRLAEWRCPMLLEQE
jgi:hypothetical protein